MSGLATGFDLILPPQVAVGEVTRVVAVLTGGTDLDAPLTIHLAGDFVSASPNGFVTIVIQPGEYAGSVAFPVVGWSAIRVSRSGGNADMADPSPVYPHLIGPSRAPVSGITLMHLDVAAGTLPTWTSILGRPSGKGHLIGVTLAGLALPGPVVLTLADDAGGAFLGGRVDWDGRPGDAPLYSFIDYYFPASPGLRTVTAAVAGIPGGLTSSISFDANL